MLSLTVILDTNILTVPAQFGVDIFSETERILERDVEFVVLDSVVNELKRIISSATKAKARPFRMALDLVKRCKVVETEEMQQDIPVDDKILKYAISSNGVVATNDGNLKERAISQGTPVLFLRGKKKLQMVGFTF